MESKKILVSLVALLAIVAIFANITSADSDLSGFADITSIEISGEEALASVGGVDDIAAFAGQTIPVRVTFEASEDVSDVRVKVWIAGEREFAVSSERFKVFNGSTYTRLLSVQIPFDIDPREGFNLEVVVESRDNGLGAAETVHLAGQRESYIVEILDVNAPTKITAGDTLPLDIVLKNRGLEFAEDTFVRASIPALGIEEKAYFGDLSPVDQPLEEGSDDRIDKEDAAERRMLLSIPSGAKAGVYTIEFEAYNSDSATTLSKKVAVVGAGDESIVVSPALSKTFAAGEKAAYSLTLVNSGNRVRIYELAVNAPDELSVSADELIVVVPAGTSRTVKLDASAKKEGKYSFTVDVNSAGNLVKSETFTAMVEGKSRVVATGNTTVLLTVVLAIIFVVLLVVLIVLLTRKPEKGKELGESYY